MVAGEGSPRSADLFACESVGIRHFVYSALWKQQKQVALLRPTGEFVVSVLSQEFVLGASKAKWLLLESQCHLSRLSAGVCLIICHLVIFQKEFTPRAYSFIS